MRITAIEQVGKGRYRVIPEDKQSFILYGKELREYHLKEGEFLEEEIFAKIMKEVLPLRAKKRCLYLLGQRSYTEEKMREKLREGEYPADVIEDTIEYLISYHYLDDLSYACDYIFYHKENSTRRQMEEKLRRKGIRGCVIEEAFQEAFEEEEEEKIQLELARKLMIKRRFDPSASDQKEYQKQYAFLMRKGFSSSIIRSVLSGE